MTLLELKDWINKLPEKFNEYIVVNGEIGKLEDDYFYRVDKPITTLTVDEEHQEIIILNEVDDLNEMNQ